jgi:hypothetical protein
MPGNGPAPSGRATYALMTSSLWPRMDTVSAIMPSYWSVWYMRAPPCDGSERPPLRRPAMLPRPGLPVKASIVPGRGRGLFRLGGIVTHACAAAWTRTASAYWVKAAIWPLASGARTGQTAAGVSPC